MSDRLRALVLGLLLCLPCLLVPRPAAAAGDAQNLELCRQVLSHILCKKAGDFAYMGKLDDGVYVISVFYASKPSEYLCAVMPDGQVIVQDRTWRAMRRVVPYTLDAEGRCMQATYTSPDCPNRSAIKVCPPKGKQDAKEKMQETFWNRPIPKVLEEEYKAMGAREKQEAAPQAAPPADAPEK